MIFDRVACDNCNVYPLIGVRYKCSVCKNFDFCQNCEETVSHPHAFIKLTSPDIHPVSIVTAIDEEQPSEQNSDVNVRQPQQSFRDIRREGWRNHQN